jgi:hypothetical protein
MIQSTLLMAHEHPDERVRMCLYVYLWIAAPNHQDFGATAGGCQRRALHCGMGFWQGGQEIARWRRWQVVFAEETNIKAGKIIEDLLRTFACAPGSGFWSTRSY